MLTSAEIQDKQFKTGLGYDKKDVEQFIHDLSSDYNILQQENADLRKKLKDFDHKLSYYKSIEKTLQKALILAEKTAHDTRATALKEAENIEQEAKMKANHILIEAKKQKELYEHKILNLMQQYDLFKIHFENLLNAQIELLSSKSFIINTEDFSYHNTSEDAIMQSEAAAANDKELTEELTSDTNSYGYEPEDINQITFDFLKEDDSEVSYQTEDGFEFFTIKDE